VKRAENKAVDLVPLPVGLKVGEPPFLRLALFFPVVDPTEAALFVASADANVVI
jgi:hypothetical protein